MTHQQYSHIRSAITHLLKVIGEDPTREGLKDTPQRVAAMYEEVFAGYGMDPESVFKTFTEGACDEMVILKDIDFTSFCEHHMLPFTGTATIGYLPAGKIVGVSKLARLLDIFAKRLQVQERLTEQVAWSLQTHLQPLGSACLIRASHSCMSCRGVRKIGCEMITSCLLGAFRDNASARAEFLALANA